MSSTLESRQPNPTSSDTCVVPTDPTAAPVTDPRLWHLGTRVVAMPSDTNAYGDIFGGWLMAQADLAGSTVAIQVAQGRVATVAVKEFRFLAPVLVGDLVDLFARMQHLGNSSVTIEVQIWTQREPDPASRHQAAAAAITYVAVDDNGRPRRITPPAELAD
ncbi:acyl-CoA thioesterase [Marichromatium bheemlicum]|uniref:Acyl-CoA thioesterase n=1 Tax=Marichromatium bheemlicum TaxID=365339 RepID=A0ABX1ICL6_9GAMM|nr:acyl-CoA thioesterase [Marichromatium bheemlicum]NKN34661.1 acyl-CoA thioesterase [Marichromatium bheemlicum]